MRGTAAKTPCRRGTKPCPAHPAPCHTKQSYERVLVLLAVQAIILLVALVPLALRVFVPGPSAKILGAVNAFTTRLSRAIMTGIVFLFSAYLLTKALLEAR